MIARNTVLKFRIDEGYRPISRFVETAKRFESTITIACGNVHVDAKSVRGLVASPFKDGSVVTLAAAGPDEEDAVTALLPMMSG